MRPAHLSSTNFAIRNRDQRRDWREGPLAGSGPSVRSLLHAAGMAPDSDETATTVSADSYRGLPLVGLLDTQTDGTRYCAATIIDDRGRLADRAALRAMNWNAATAITISTIPRSGIVLVRSRGGHSVTQQGFLRLPADIRHACRISAGDRLLVVAHPDEQALVIYTPFGLDTMTAAYHATIAPEEIA